MIKKINDIVMTRDGKVAMVEALGSHKGIEVAGIRLYRSQKRLVVPVDSLRRHTWLNDVDDDTLGNYLRECDLIEKNI